MTQPYRCPVDNTALVMSERQGIEIDYCLNCRGVWLDRGELDKIIDRNAAAQPSAGAQLQEPDPWARQQRQSNQGYGHKPQKRRKSFLEDLFD